MGAFYESNGVRGSVWAVRAKNQPFSRRVLAVFRMVGADRTGGKRTAYNTSYPERVARAEGMGGAADSSATGAGFSIMERRVFNRPRLLDN